jgi:hypothetical protein
LIDHDGREYHDGCRYEQGDSQAVQPVLT